MEIKEKTGGLWIPSKGTLYPVLNQLKDEELIEIVATGKRAKTTFAVTETGREYPGDREREGKGASQEDGPVQEPYLRHLRRIKDQC